MREEKPTTEFQERGPLCVEKTSEGSCTEGSVFAKYNYNPEHQSDSGETLLGYYSSNIWHSFGGEMDNV